MSNGMNFQKMYLISSQKWAKLSSKKSGKDFPNEQNCENIPKGNINIDTEKNCHVYQYHGNNEDDNKANFSKNGGDSRTDIRVDQNENTKVKNISIGIKNACISENKPKENEVKRTKSETTAKELKAGTLEKEFISCNCPNNDDSREKSKFLPKTENDRGENETDSVDELGIKSYRPPRKNLMINQSIISKEDSNNELKVKNDEVDEINPEGSKKWRRKSGIPQNREYCGMNVKGYNTQQEEFNFCKNLRSSNLSSSVCTDIKESMNNLNVKRPQKFILKNFPTPKIKHQLKKNNSFIRRASLSKVSTVPPPRKRQESNGSVLTRKRPLPCNYNDIDPLSKRKRNEFCKNKDREPKWFSI